MNKPKNNDKGFEELKPWYLIFSEKSINLGLYIDWEEDEEEIK